MSVVIDDELNAYAYFKKILKNISTYSVPSKVSNINENYNFTKSRITN